jgi:hypothetical protein
MDLQPLPRRYLVAYASASGFAENTIVILSRLGYEILSPERFEKLRMSGDFEGEVDRPPDLLLVDERRLCEVPAGELGSEVGGVPIVVLTEAGSMTQDDSRIVAAVRQPVGMHELYRVLQEVVEERVRSSFRVSTELPAVCRLSGREWQAEVVCLSESGCRLRSPEVVPLGSVLQLALEIPAVGTVHVRAESAYQLLPDLGLTFSSLSPHVRQAIGSFVTEALLVDDPASGVTTR